MLALILIYYYSFYEDDWQSYITFSSNHGQTLFRSLIPIAYGAVIYAMCMYNSQHMYCIHLCRIRFPSRNVILCTNVYLPYIVSYRHSAFGIRCPTQHYGDAHTKEKKRKYAQILQEKDKVNSKHKNIDDKMKKTHNRHT